MQICANHWKAMREKVEELGMTHLVSRSGEDALEIIKLAVEAVNQQNAASPPFDPLLNANFAILNKFIEGFHPDDRIGAMMNVECPLCWLEERHAGRAANWIDGCLQDQLGFARSLKLIPEVQ